MGPELLYDALRAAMRATTVISLPILGAALTVGLVIGLLQALTSVQEATLTFVPKLAAIGVAFWLSMAFMTETLVAFFRTGIVPLIAAG